MRLIVPDKAAIFRDTHLNRSCEIKPNAVRRGVCGSFFPVNFRPEVASDVISEVAVDDVSVNVRVKFGEPMPHGS